MHPDLIARWDDHQRKNFTVLTQLFTELGVDPQVMNELIQNPAALSQMVAGWKLGFEAEGHLAALAILERIEAAIVDQGVAQIELLVELHEAGCDAHSYAAFMIARSEQLAGWLYVHGSEIGISCEPPAPLDLETREALTEICSDQWRRFVEQMQIPGALEAIRELRTAR